MSNDRYICIHGHFYQPPRENPWLEAIELQDSAYPHHDWNERISAECYATNATSRVLDGEGRIERIVNNYGFISYNFGPTLLAWLAAFAPDVYEAVLEADRESAERFGGHGSAMAQCYNHMIMPLGHPRDKRTQILWGIRDFEARFGRRPEGMWLPETAVDLESLDLMAEQGVKFTVLAPRQASRIRPVDGEEWEDVSGERIDPTTAYVQHLPSGRSIALFFYDGPISRGVAFEDVLTRGEDLAHRLAGAFHDSRPWPQIVNIATDGETFGHHHRHGEMALSYALHTIEEKGIAKLINYGQFLELHPPRFEVEIHENSSWSCVHGVERWRSDCGCNSGMHGGWNQRWRQPLREALDWLRDRAAALYEKSMAPILRDPWEARDEYIAVILDRSPENIVAFVQRHARHPLDRAGQTRVLKALELQRHAMLMYTSCGWFFDELSGIETTQVIMYAGRVLQLGRDIFGEDLEQEFLALLEKAPSNIPEHANGKVIYEKFVRPAIVDLMKVGAHYAVSSLFHDYADEARIYAFGALRLGVEARESGRSRMVVGHARLVSEITLEEEAVTYAVLSLGDHNVFGGVRPHQGEDAFGRLIGEMVDAFSRADVPQLIRRLDQEFEASTWSLRSLFRDEQRAILHTVLRESEADVEGGYRRMYEQYAPLMRFIANLHMPLPKAFGAVAEFALNSLLAEELQNDPLNPDRLRNLFEDAKAGHVPLDLALMEMNLRRNLERRSAELVEDPCNLELLARLETGLSLIAELPFELHLWKLQNNFWSIMQNSWADQCRSAEAGEEPAREWTERFGRVVGLLGLRMQGDLLKRPDAA